MTEWIKWNGGECPVHPKTVVRVQLRCQSIEYADTNDFVGSTDLRWTHTGEGGDIIAYKIIQEYQLTIAETIREAAINWPQFLGDVECDVLGVFGRGDEYWVFFLNHWNQDHQFQARTFMLLVAEALE
jgi:hypothetical protein